MKSAILTVFQNRLITSTNLVSVSLSDTVIKLQLTNTYYIAQGNSKETALTMYNQTLSELSKFDLFTVDTNYVINLSMITGANIAEPTVTNSLYTVYIILQKSKISKCFSLEEEATNFLQEISTSINSLTADLVERVDGDMVDNTDASHPVINHDDTKLNTEDIEVPNSHLVFLGRNLEMSPNNLFKIVDTYRDMNDSSLVSKTCNVISNTLQSTYVSNGDFSSLSINVKDEVSPPVIPTPDLVVYPAPLNDTANEVDLSNYSYSVSQTEENGTYNLIIRAENLPIHTNANNTKGAWCGIAIPVDDEFVYNLAIDKKLYSNVDLEVVKQKNCVVIYFDALKQATKSIRLYKDFTLLYNIILNFDVSIKE